MNFMLNLFCSGDIIIYVGGNVYFLFPKKKLFKNLHFYISFKIKIDLLKMQTFFIY